MWILFTIATTLLWGLAELFYKKGSLPNEKYSHLKIVVCVGIMMGIHAVWTLLTKDFHYSFTNILFYFPVSFCYILSMALSFFGMRFIEESLSDPIENTSGAICSLLCVIFLGNHISSGSVISIIVILFGILGIGFIERNSNSYIHKNISKKLALIAFAMPFCYALLDALGSFLDIFYLSVNTTPLINFSENTIEDIANTSYELTFAFIALILLLFMCIKGIKFNILTQKDKLLAAFFETCGQFTYIHAMSGKGYIAAPIISSVCVVSLIFSRLFLKEKLSNKQYFFIMLVILGIISLAIIEGD